MHNGIPARSKSMQIQALLPNNSISFLLSFSFQMLPPTKKCSFEVTDLIFYTNLYNHTLPPLSHLLF